MTSIKTVIVDDSESDRLLLKNRLSKLCPQIEIIGEANARATGFQQIRALKPQLVFLDIELQPGTGFDILNDFLKIGSIDFKVIFFTGHGTKENLRKAINYAALQVLEKPIGDDNLQDVVNVIQALVQTETYNQQLQMMLDLVVDKIPSKLPVETMRNGTLFLEKEKIVYLEADGSVTDFYLSDGTKVTGKKNLGQYRHSLEGKSSVFHMVHRSYVINENYLHRLESEQVILSMGNRLQEVPISRNMGRKFKEYLNLRG